MRRSLTLALVLVIASAPLHSVAQAQQFGSAPLRDSAARVRAVTVLPGTGDDAFTSIRGRAVDVTNSPLTDTAVRLRNARSGRIVDQTLTDTSGSFVFFAVDPGSYLVEIMAPDRNTVLTASGILDGNAGDAVTTVVRVPAAPPLGGTLGRTAGVAAIVIGAAAASGVLAVRVAGPSVSPRG